MHIAHEQARAKYINKATGYAFREALFALLNYFCWYTVVYRLLYFCWYRVVYRLLHLCWYTVVNRLLYSVGIQQYTDFLQVYMCTIFPNYALIRLHCNNIIQLHSFEIILLYIANFDIFSLLRLSSKMIMRVIANYTQPHATAVQQPHTATEHCNTTRERHNQH